MSGEGDDSSPVHGGSRKEDKFKVAGIFAKVEFVRVCVEYVYVLVTTELELY